MKNNVVLYKMKWELNIFKSKLKKLKKKNNQGFVLQKELSSVQLLSHVQLFASPWTAACQASLSITNSQSLLKLTSIKSVMPSNNLILFFPFSSCLQSFPVSGSSPMSQFFASRG